MFLDPRLPGGVGSSDHQGTSLTHLNKPFTFLYVANNFISLPVSHHSAVFVLLSHLYCFALEMRKDCIRRGEMSHSSLAATVSLSGRRDRWTWPGIVCPADAVATNGHCGCECVSLCGQIRQKPLPLPGCDCPLASVR